MRSASFSASSRSWVVSRIVVLVHIGQPVHQVVELAPGGRVEARRRLVEEQQLGPADDADRHVEPPALTAGEPPIRWRACSVSPTASSSSSAAHGRRIRRCE